MKEGSVKIRKTTIEFAKLRRDAGSRPYRQVYRASATLVTQPSCDEKFSQLVLIEFQLVLIELVFIVVSYRTLIRKSKVY